jgi:hypothetical protein
MNTENTIKNIELFEILKSNDLTGKITYRRAGIKRVYIFKRYTSIVPV